MVPLPTVVVEALAGHLATFGEGPERLVSTTERGRPIRRSTMGDVWRAAREEVGTDSCGPHDLRHFYASLLIHAGRSVKAVQSVLGHAAAVVLSTR